MGDVLHHLHDGFVDGILLSGKEATVLLRTVSGETFDMKLSDVEYLKADDFLQGNIILQVVLHTGDCPADLLASLCALSPYDPGAGDFLLRLQARVRDEQMVLVEITPSYGCSLLALCKAARISPVQRPTGR